MNTALQESREENKELKKDLKLANQHSISSKTSFSDYQQKVKKETETAFKVLQGQIDTYQMLFFSLAGGMMGCISGYNLNGPVGGLIGAGAGIGAGIVVTIIF